MLAYLHLPTRSSSLTFLQSYSYISGCTPIKSYWGLIVITRHQALTWSCLGPIASNKPFLGAQFNLYRNLHLFLYTFTPNRYTYDYTIQYAEPTSSEHILANSSLMVRRCNQSPSFQVVNRRTFMVNQNSLGIIPLHSTGSHSSVNP